jgi:hypothetical protein
MAIDYPKTTHQDIVKECLDHLDMAQHMSIDFNLHEL